MIDARTQCPQCSAAIQVKDSDYSPISQGATCPQGHDVYRVWNGPENPHYDRNKLYGWSVWKLA